VRRSEGMDGILLLTIGMEATEAESRGIYTRGLFSTVEITEHRAVERRLRHPAR